jgi:hypothetical protein
MSLLSKEAAIAAVRKLHEGISCGFVLRKYVDVMKRKGLKLTSSFYDPYFLICYENTLMHASWAVCPYYADGTCVIEKAVRKFFAFPRRHWHLPRSSAESHRKEARFRISEADSTEKARCRRKKGCRNCSCNRRLHGF